VLKSKESYNSGALSSPKSITSLPRQSDGPVFSSIAGSVVTVSPGFEQSTSRCEELKVSAANSSGEIEPADTDGTAHNENLPYAQSFADKGILLALSSGLQAMVDSTRQATDHAVGADACDENTAPRNASTPLQQRTNRSPSPWDFVRSRKYDVLKSVSPRKVLQGAKASRSTVAHVASGKRGRSVCHALPAGHRKAPDAGFSAIEVTPSKGAHKAWFSPETDTAGSSTTHDASKEGYQQVQGKFAAYAQRIALWATADQACCC
jgi:hypothetical protein